MIDRWLEEPCDPPCLFEELDERELELVLWDRMQNYVEQFLDSEEDAPIYDT